MNRPQEADNLWWESFATEFFDDDARLTITAYFDEGLKSFSIGRRLIPRYFRTWFEDGVTDCYMVPRMAKETFMGNVIMIECDMASQIATHTKPTYCVIQSDGRLTVEFNLEDNMRIKSWNFYIRAAHELVPKGYNPMDGQQQMQEFGRPVSRGGISSATLNFLKLCSIMEPMQELFSFHKTFRMEPRECLKNCLFQKWSRIMQPTDGGPREGARPRGKKRSRKPGANSRSKPRTPASEILVAGEPTIMGGETQEDERPITRIENGESDQIDSKVEIPPVSDGMDLNLQIGTIKSEIEN
ncbi:Oidioi.mRNA.OKI2018_I69.PAR.g9587.t1.cds [Oikopleura dioica]|uniref:Oidioi.mRNA.OKI2018_I69.PAR.g9587.t1.cds n=1 Tax=Oikopleura dioica TaxID=34765 RepID=A0ABN7RLI8_OIKDI|nr:Oidioi.mRNA.OKI2018_I69.PAR.g9587.t1.cds [Oikopleura dioica]